MSGILRRCAALLSATALIGTLSVSPVHADDFSRVDRDPVAGLPVVLDDGREPDTALFSLRVADEDSVRAYAMVADEEVRPRTAYVESAWADRPEWTDTAWATDPADRANWIVSNSYPHLPLLSLGLSTGVPLLEEQTAIAATQAALWHVLDGAEPDREANPEDVLRVFDHLVEGSTAAQGGTTARSLELSPTHVEAVAPAEPLGPLTITSAGEEPVRLSVRGAPASWLVDSEGREVSLASDGDEVYLAVDPSVPAGVVTLHARGSSVPLEEGRLFTGREGVRTQPLVTAEPGMATSSTTATFTWHAEEPAAGDVDDEPMTVAPEEPAPLDAEPTEEPEAVTEVPETDDRNPDEGLAFTGTWLSGLLVIAGALVVSGLLILVLGRKRR
ncbi:Cys-Gln thioester bond-forming surface protein [Nocardiopsis sp. MG754419]|uniref:Cys-Gln thioester bond-forming surface protein n=1 Tax=Nocardiopsis sp. MG754419 TaxID=2259865 RepID=UPI001BA59F63|nr:Cys-Gln thioester bond-forming surface protein [Nocardiopsis sp. MG754419]MBR8740481.1 peptidase [Nocardiopsis sp. MG754419]